jgi:hypothetical protein
MFKYQLSLDLLALISLGLVLCARGQNYCDSAEALSRTNYAGYLEADSCNCGAASVCGECTAGGDSGIVSCNDGCTYTSGTYTVQRAFTSSYFTIYVFDVAVPSILLGFSHEFTEGAQGQFIYTYEGVLNDDLSLSPASGGTCSFSFNGADCACEEFYCDEAQTISANRIDCSALEGGAVLDFCSSPEITDTSSLLEILYAVPRIGCSGSPSNTAPTVPAPVPLGTGGPSFTGGLTSSPALGPEEPQNSAPTSPGIEASPATDTAAPSVSATAEGGTLSTSDPTVVVVPAMTNSPAPAAMVSSQSKQPLATSNTLSSPQTDPALVPVGGTASPIGSSPQVAPQSNRGVSSVDALSTAVSGCALLVATFVISTL